MGLVLGRLIPRMCGKDQRYSWKLNRCIYILDWIWDVRLGSQIIWIDSHQYRHQIPLGYLRRLGGFLTSIDYMDSSPVASIRLESGCDKSCLLSYAISRI